MAVLQPLQAMHEKKPTNKLLPLITILENETHTREKNTAGHPLAASNFLFGDGSQLEGVNRTKKMDYVWQG